MKLKETYILRFFTILFVLSGCNNQQSDKIVEAIDTLPSWNESTTKSSIINFVKDVTNSEGENFIPIADRIATFDNDGNLWSKQPAYF